MIQYDPNDAFLLASMQRRAGIWTMPRLAITKLPTIVRGETEVAADELGLPLAAPTRLAHLHGWQSVERAYERIAEMCRERQVVSLAIVPFWEPLHTPEDMQREFNMQKLLARVGMPWVDTRPTAQSWEARTGKPLTELLIDYPHDSHPTVEGHKLIAEAVAPPLFEALIRLPAVRQVATTASIARAFAELPMPESAGAEETGFYATERWGAEPVRWADSSSATVLRPPAGAIGVAVRYMLGHPDLSEKRPVTVSFRLAGRPERIVEHTAAGFHEARFDLAPPGYESAPAELVLRIDVSRYFEESPGEPSRRLAIALMEPVYYTTGVSSEDGSTSSTALPDHGNSSQ